MAEGDQDRRVRRTKAALRAAVVELVADKGYQAVTVEHICERADVTRATFYSHFRDKEHLLSSVADDLVERGLDAFEAAGGGVDHRGERLVVLFQQARNNEAAFRLVLRGEGDGAALHRLRDRLTVIVADTMETHRRTLRTTPSVPLELVTQMCVGEILAVLEWWLERDDDETGADAVVSWLRAAGLYGRLWALGADDAALSRPRAAAFRAGLPPKE